MCEQHDRSPLNLFKTHLLPPANEVCEGYVLHLSVSHSVHRGFCIGGWGGSASKGGRGVVQSYLFSLRDAESVRHSIPTILPKASD